MRKVEWPSELWGVSSRNGDLVVTCQSLVGLINLRLELGVLCESESVKTVGYMSDIWVAEWEWIFRIGLRFQIKQDQKTICLKYFVGKGCILLHMQTIFHKGFLGDI